MRQILLLQAIILMGTNGFSQTLNFTVASPQPNIIEAYGGVFASGDINGDGHKDLLMTTNSKQTKIYSNNGTGSFTELSHNLPRSSQGQAIFKDLDNDFDLDLFFSGENQLNQTFTNIYRNNGFGVFTQVPNALPITTYTRVALFDVDSDGDQDMVLSTPSVAGVYLNNGNAVFTPQSNSAFTLVGGIVESIDLENDGDKDVIISGGNSTKLYRNNGSGNFTLVTNTSLPAISAEDIDVADVDNDGDFDFLINGNFQNLLYINNGSGVFTPITTTFQQTSSGENAIADLDNDGDQDILIVGTQAGGLPNVYNKVYKNNGNNVFVETQILGGEYIADCIIDDFTGDGLKDIIIQGFAHKTTVYWNTSSTLGVSELVAANQEVVFYPNPARDIVTISSKEIIEDIVIYNLLGQEVLSKEINSNQSTIDISNFSQGTYVVKLNGNSEGGKFIKL